MIQHYIVDHVDDDPRGIARRVAQAYGISRQAANRHLDALVGAGVLEEAGHTRARAYALRRSSAVSRELRVTPVLNSARVWDDAIAPILAGDRAIVRETCRGIFKELVENTIRHASASWISIELTTSARQIDLAITDDGRGIFGALAERLMVATPRDAAEEFARRAQLRSMESPAARLMLLARGAEAFAIESSGIVCEFEAANDLWVVRESEEARAGTTVSCRLKRVVSREGRIDEPIPARVSRR